MAANQRINIIKNILNTQDIVIVVQLFAPAGNRTQNLKLHRKVLSLQKVICFTSFRLLKVTNYRYLYK